MVIAPFASAFGKNRPPNIGVKDLATETETYRA
jgi:hypothetical protein